MTMRRSNYAMNAMNAANGTMNHFAIAEIEDEDDEEVEYDFAM